VGSSQPLITVLTLLQQQWSTSLSLVAAVPMGVRQVVVSAVAVVAVDLLQEQTILLPLVLASR